MNIYFPENLRTEFEEHAKKGIFIKRDFSTWCSKVVYRTKGKQRLYFQASHTIGKYDKNRKILTAKVRDLFNFYGYRTVYGYFFPEKNLEFYRKEIVQISKAFEDFKVQTLENYKEISNEAKKKYAEVAYFKWINELKNSGAPPEIFIEQYCKEKIEDRCSPEKILKECKFCVTNINPFIEENRTSYGKKEEIQRYNQEVIENLYKSIIAKRKMLVYYLVAKNKILKSNRSVYKSIATFLCLWKNCVFYSDPILIQKIDGLRYAIIRSFTRDKEIICPLIEEIIEYLLNHKEYQLGLLYEKK